MTVNVATGQEQYVRNTRFDPTDCANATGRLAYRVTRTINKEIESD